LIITDDQGYGDFGAHGNTMIQTPHLDQLHAESVRFTNFHVDPTCSPTRGALMTGKYSHRAKVWHTIAGGNHLRSTEMTMADVFKANGYRTGMFGKWHLGSNYPYRPMDRGFEEWLGQGDGGTGTTDDYFDNDRVDDVYLHNGEREFRQGYAPEVFFDAAIDFFKHRPNDQPFFIYLSTYTPHSPHTLADRDWAQNYIPAVGERVAYFFAAIERVDRSLGKLRQALESEGLDNKTILLFMTDNGGTAGVDFFNAGMRGRKGSPYDGGHRVPLFIHWPAGAIKQGQDANDLTAHFDVLPTLIDLLDLKTPRAVQFDGRSFKKQLFNPSLHLEARTLMVEQQRTFTPEKWANAVAMTRKWRLVNNEELYDMEKDPGQQENLIQEHPQIVERLRQDFEAYWHHVSPGDRDRVVHVVGHPDDPETFLSSSDWYAPRVPWNHAHTSMGQTIQGTWHIRTHEAGMYRFEVRRWPKEVETPIAGIPSMQKKADAWDAGGAKRFLIYSGEDSPFKALPVNSIRLRVGEKIESKLVKATDTKIVFDVSLKRDLYEISADLLDAEGNILTGAYYTYCRKL
ncbi:MAG: arylsulfatase, partial [Verrucomicrobiae bacterium]|nr:arylsulfatase [Verrucomicrobiae bacterium]